MERIDDNPRALVYCPFPDVGAALENFPSHLIWVIDLDDDMAKFRPTSRRGDCKWSVFVVLITSGNGVRRPLLFFLAS